MPQRAKRFPHEQSARCGVLLSIKQGAWFEKENERGWTTLAEQWLVASIKRLLADAGVNASVSSETTCDRLRIAVFSNDGYQEIADAIARVVQGHEFNSAAFQQAKEQLRLEWLFIEYDRRELALRKVASVIPPPNHMPLTSIEWLTKNPPSMARVQKYWSRLVNASDIALYWFGPWPQQTKRELVKLTRRTKKPSKAKWSASDFSTFHFPRLHGVVWKESSFHPLYAILDTVMAFRTKGDRLRYDCGPWRGYGVVGTKRDMDERLHRTIGRREWARAKRELLHFLKRVDSMPEDYAFYFDDGDEWSYGSFGIRSFESFVEFIRKSVYEEFCEYVSAVGFS